MAPALTFHDLSQHTDYLHMDTMTLVCLQLKEVNKKKYRRYLLEAAFSWRRASSASSSTGFADRSS